MKNMFMETQQTNLKDSLKRASNGVITMKQMSTGPVIKMESDQTSVFEIRYFLNYLKELEKNHLISKEEFEFFLNNLNWLIYRFYELLQNDSVVGLSYGEGLGESLEDFYKTNINPNITLELLRNSRISVIKKSYLEIEDGSNIKRLSFSVVRIGAAYRFIFAKDSFADIGHNGKNFFDKKNSEHVWEVINDFNEYIKSLVKKFFTEEIATIGDFNISFSLLSILIILRLEECITQNFFEELQIV